MNIFEAEYGSREFIEKRLEECVKNGEISEMDSKQMLNEFAMPYNHGIIKIPNTDSINIEVISSMLDNFVKQRKSEKEERVKNNKIKFISGANWAGSYYTDKEGKLYNGSTGSVYIEDFIHKLNLDVEFLEYHTDLVYFDNGINCNVQDLYPYRFKTFNEIPKWCYSKNNDLPLIPQLNKEELEELHKYLYSGKYTKN